ncbi:MAG: C4-dicarboxylate TRAP transporter substrate-binding protein [Proteobacteria bacterium]|nr:C4-dicarboxylate TRAP transporter substrate-binding protein [Pseudomonadota bacterium]MBU1712345.1 C4-dicarboxylate TRAP transporter substrate-binding protein [Pseudomonadota bacterium]
MIKFLQDSLIVGLTAIVLVFCVSSGVSAKTVLKMNHQFPASAAGSKIDQWFADEVKKATGGEVEIQIFWSNALGAAKENLTLLRGGAIDMAGMSPGYFPSELPLFCAPNSIPMAMDNIRQSSAIMKAFMDKVPAFMEEAKQQQIRPLFFHLLNPYLLVTRDPVTKLEDLKGKKIRTWGEDLPRLFQAADAVPVNIFLPELYENLQRKVIDGCPFGVDMVLSYKLQDITKNITEIVIWEGPAWGVWISEKSWQKLSPENQKKILEIVEKAREMELKTTAEEEVKAREALKTAGVQFHSFKAGDLERWKKASPDFFNDWIDKMQKLGKGDAAKQTISIWKEMREKIK